MLCTIDCGEKKTINLLIDTLNADPRKSTILTFICSVLNHLEEREKQNLSWVQEIAVCRIYLRSSTSQKRKKENLLPFFCCILVNNREIIKCTFSGKPCRTKSVKNLTFSLECFLDDYKNRNKRLMCGQK